MRYYLLIAMAFLATGCHRSLLSVRSEYLTPRDLASEHILTPDPLRDCFYGQQLVVHWHVPAPCFFSGKTWIDLSIRFKNLEIEKRHFPLPTSLGFLTVKYINEEYWSKGGVVSFKVELFKEGELLECWSHHLWVDLIETRIVDSP